MESFELLLLLVVALLLAAACSLVFAEGEPVDLSSREVDLVKAGWL
jgi:hypothetical protein